MKYFHIVFVLFVLMIAASGMGMGQQQQPSAPPAQGTAPDYSAIEQKMRDLEDRVVMLEGQLRQMKAQGALPPAATPQATPEPGTAPATTTASVDQPRLGGAGGAASKALNP